MSHSIYPHSRMTGRTPELLDQIKSEFETLAHDVNMYKIQRDDYERKLQAQLSELATIQQAVFDLERTHTKLKQNYDEEVLKMRRELSNSNNNSNNNNNNNNSNNNNNNNNNVISSSGISGNTRDLNSPVNPGLPYRPISPAPGPQLSSNRPTSLTPNPPGLPPPDKNGGIDKRPFPGPPLIPNAPNAPSNTSNPSTQPLPNNPAGKRSRGGEPEFYAPGFPLLSPIGPNSAEPKPKSGGGATEKKESSGELMPTLPGLRGEHGLSKERSDSLNGSGLSGINPGSSGGSGPEDNHKQDSPDNLPIMNPEAKKTRTNPPTASLAGSNSSHNLLSSVSNSSNANAAGNPTNSSSSNSSSTNIPDPTNEIDDMKSDKGGSDWIVGYNPGVQTNLNIDLLHNLGHSSVVCCVKFSGDGKYLATGCNRSAQIYDVESGRKVHTFADESIKDGDLYIRSVSFSPDGQYLATGAEDKTVKVWDIAHKRILHTFTGHELDIYSLDFNYSGRFIVSGSGDKKAKIWDVEKGKCAYTLGNEEVGPKDGVTSVAISPDGRLVAAGSLDRIVRLWDAQTGYFLERYEGHLDSVYSVAFSPDGKSLASGSLDKTLKLWDLSGSRARSRCRSTFNGHKDFVLSVAFSPDGNWLISGSKDRSVQFWDPRSAVTHMMLQGHKNSVISVAVSPNPGTFATGSGDFRARLWKYES
eukprot:TRINITY_DN3277_c1_g1_i1.p1 TRINITY_DN3277_c1_g1~~TRINITY_DN3277_c1_g1_i1.p1  ORF type:complete len:697 (+),score=150.04 TRINITY_DN3277_c1_g1_i1:437-2527(+)